MYWRSDWIIWIICFVPLVIFCAGCVLFGALGNGVVIWATGFRMKKSVSTVWYLNLAVADFLVTAFLPLKIIALALSLNYQYENHWPPFMIKMDSLLFFTSMYASVYTLVVMSVDRCVCVVCPVWTQNHRTVRKASWVSLGVWLMASALSIPHVISVEVYPMDFLHNPDLRLMIADFVVTFVVPFSVIVSCYSVVNYRLRNNRSLARQSGLSLATVVAATFFLCWLPYHIIKLIIVCTDERQNFPSSPLLIVTFLGYPLSYALALLNSWVNPLLYVFSQGCCNAFRSIHPSILKVLEKAFSEESPQTNNTPTDPAVIQMISLSEIEGSTGPPGTVGTQDPGHVPAV